VLASHFGAQVSFPGDITWDSWWTKRYCLRYFFRFLHFPILSIILPLLRIVYYDPMKYTIALTRKYIYTSSTFKFGVYSVRSWLHRKEGKYIVTLWQDLEDSLTHGAELFLRGR
jgi:hypothetical protein